MTEDPRSDMLDRQKYINRRVNERQRSMERRALRAILSAFKVKGRTGIIREMDENEYTLEWLWEQHPTCPVRLMAKDIYRWSWDDLFTRFAKTPVFEAFEDSVDCYGSDMYTGAVFHGSRVGELIVHNWNGTLSYGTHLIRDTSRYGTLIVGQFKDFLKCLVRDWEPQGYPLGG